MTKQNQTSTNVDSAFEFYPKRITDQFVELILNHTKTLDKNYWNRKSNFDGFYSENPTQESVIKNDIVSECGGSLSEYILDKYESVVIGQIDEKPLYFVEKFGAYYYSGDPGANVFLELWISGDRYPENW
ncbi:MAG: hypothetical protein Q7U38_04920 [Methylobacter sp.]|nr:hypothetical protein [Methylobacter sp.]MDP2100648.1 hypothetical protein [Methylobacter sp.]MDP2426825.1 hypothetical protein [Methylobacter sp.]MDP3054558.1 hypothetical protein [Methylobacter sp.]MDP3362422.1 hypothetical protein [Methylobacter sp.]